MTKLKDITGKALSGEWGTDDETGVGIPVLRTTNFTNEGIVNYENVVTRIITKKDISEKYLQSGDIIIEKSGGSDKQPVGRVIYFDGPENTYLFNNFTGLLRVRDKNEWFPRYVFYSLFANYKKGGTRPFENKTTGLHNLKTDDYVSRYEITEIPVNKQIAICSQLDQILKVINLRRKELSNLDDLIKARFIELFGEPLSNQKGWQTMSIVEAAPIKSQRGDLGDEVWLLNLDAVEAQTGTVLFKHRVQSGKINASTVFFTTESVLYSKLRPYLNKVVMPNEDGVATSEMIPMYPLADRLNRAYLCYWLRSDAFVRHISEKVAGAKMPRVSMDYFRSLAIELPPLELQGQFADFVAQIDKSKLLSGCRFFHSWAPANRDNLNRVGVPRRRTKSLRRGRRQQ